jgi:hypothetical protein
MMMVMMTMIMETIRDFGIVGVEAKIRTGDR